MALQAPSSFGLPLSSSTFRAWLYMICRFHFVSPTSRAPYLQFLVALPSPDLTMLTAALISLFTLSLPHLSLSAPASVASYGTITAPPPGTAVAPGANFTFAYTPHADYGISSFAYHVWLLTAPDTNAAASIMAPNSATGYYFGRFDYPNYPGE
jgi:hypothetical protein